MAPCLHPICSRSHSWKGLLQQNVRPEHPTRLHRQQVQMPRWALLLTSCRLGCSRAASAAAATDAAAAVPASRLLLLPGARLPLLLSLPSLPLLSSLPPLLPLLLLCHTLCCHHGLVELQPAGKHLRFRFTPYPQLARSGVTPRRSACRKTSAPPPASWVRSLHGAEACCPLHCRPARGRSLCARCLHMPYNQSQVVHGIITHEPHMFPLQPMPPTTSPAATARVPPTLVWPAPAARVSAQASGGLSAILH